MECLQWVLLVCLQWLLVWPGGDTYDLLQAHITGAVANHNLTRDLIEAHIKGAIANHTLTQDRIEAHVNGAVAKHGEMLAKLDALLAR